MTTIAGRLTCTLVQPKRNLTMTPEVESMIETIRQSVITLRRRL